MRKGICFLLVGSLLLTACSPKLSEPESSPTITQQIDQTVSKGVESELGELETEVIHAVKSYVYAKLLTDKVSTTDLSLLPLDDLKSLTEKVSEAWVQAESAAMSLEITANQQARIGLYTFFTDLKIDWLSLLIHPVYAADPAMEWAEAITSQYDKIKGANRLKQLGEQLGTDAKRAYKELVMAQDILRDAATKDGDYYERWQKYLELTKTACKIGVFVCATIVTAGASTAAAGSVTLGEATGILVSGIDVILDVGVTSSNIVLGSDSKVVIEFDKMKDAFAPVSLVFGLSGFTNAASGERVSFVGDNLLEWFYNNKIAGIKLDSTGKVKVDSAWIVDTNGKTDQSIRKEIETHGEQYPDLSKQSVESISESYDFDIESLFRELDKIVAQIRENEKVDQEKAQETTTQLVDASQSSNDGVYSGLMTLYSPTGTTDEDSTEMYTFQINFLGNQIKISDDEDYWIMPYDATSKTAYYKDEQEGISMSIRFIDDKTVEAIIKFELIDAGVFTSKGILIKK